MFLTLWDSYRVFAIELKNGDIIFQESCSGSNVGNAIKSVTRSIGNYNFTHVGIVYLSPEDNAFYVIEATPPAVRIVPLCEFLRPDTLKECRVVSIVGRLRDKYQPCISGAIREAHRLIGKEYDYGFVLDNDKFYCSELIYAIFLKANQGIPVFELNTMTFKQVASGETDINWIQYFREKGLLIPEGELGINPGAMSRSEVIDLLGEYPEENS